MPFLVVGGLTLEVPTDAFREGDAVITSGSLSASLTGRQGGAVLAERRTWLTTPLPLTPAEWALLQVETPPGVVVTCGGDAFDGVSLGCYVRRSAVAEPDGETFTLLVTLTIEEA